MAFTDQHGAAIVTTTLAALFLALVASMATEQATVSYLIEHRLRESVEALVAAETGQSVVLAEFAAEPRFERFDLEDGSRLPIASPIAIAPLPASFVVDTRLRHRPGGRLDFVTHARGRRGAGRTLAATIERGADPYVPAALYLASEAPTITAAGQISVHGSTRAGNPVPALATRSPLLTESLRQQLAGAGAELIGTPVAVTGAWAGLGELANDLRADAGRLPETIAGALTAAVLASSGSVEVAGGSGSGVWLVDGDLNVASDLSFDGLLVVLGDIRVGEHARLAVRGSLVQLPPGRSFQIRGRAAIAYRSAALLELDTLRPGLFHRRARLIGWREDD